MCVLFNINLLILPPLDDGMSQSELTTINMQNEVESLSFYNIK